ncbi:hypothetical protein [Streptomyces monomycini]|uniref:hypothetical protein n=1 Tax=Streptomyces monomycini TaxID=371720 RepID=UPI0004AB38BB|nr:hypothetical protein [Streptomyces monomycini]
MTAPPRATGQPAPVDVERVISRATRRLLGDLTLRLVIIAALVAAPAVLTRTGTSDSPALGLFAVAAVLLALFTVYRFAFSIRLGTLRAMLRTYPLEFWPRVAKRDADDWSKYGTSFTLKISGGGRGPVPWLRAVNVLGRRRWPKEAENGAWVAGDLAFGGILVVPGSEEALFLEIAKRDKATRARAEAAPARHARAKQAGLIGKRR